MSDILLSALVVAHDEAAQLSDCLAALAFADEIVVVLDRCTDASADIARSRGARLVEGAWPLEGPRRHAGIDACRGRWILEVDADERVTAELALEIRQAIAAPTSRWFLVPVANHVGGRLIRYGWGAYNGVGAKPILFEAGAKQWGDQPVHPKIVMAGDGGRLSSPLTHYVDRDFTDMLDRLNRYTSAHARTLRASGDIGTLGPNLRRMATRFFKSYVQRKGYREGATGLMLGLFAALYPLLSYLKAREPEE